ncbi:MAG: two-component regulator propeller domain-containing protein, partial [Ferruginibacter sp.]
MLFTCRYLLLRSMGVFFFLLVCNILPGQYYFSKLSEENGLSDNRISCFLKDKSGFIWIGTKNGLNRYDGSEFLLFKPTSGNSISNESINDIVQDSSGNIWVATFSGLNRYDPITNRWETMMPTGSEHKGNLPSYLIWDLEVDENNCIWIVSDVWDFAMYNPATKKFTYYDWPETAQQKQFKSFAHYRSIQKIVRKSKNEWWLATTIGLFSVDMTSRQFKFFGAGYTGSIMDIQYHSPTNNVFVSIQNGQLFNYNENEKRYREIKPVQQLYPAVQRKQLQKSNILLASPNGILDINPVTKEVTLIEHQPALPSSILNGGTNIIYSDHTGVVWVGTNKGINFYNSHNQVADFIPL